ncbi:MAG: tripartite tricarboxylate transporter TctB family protein [Azospirillaceae bacterium]
MRASARDLVGGGTVTALAVAVLVALPFEADDTGGGIVTSASFPTWLAWALLVMGIAWTANAAGRLRRGTNAADEEPPAGWRGTLWVLAAIAAGIAYAVLLPLIGFMIASALLMAVLSLLYGGRRWTTVLLPAVILPPLVFYFFRYAMVVFLPSGTLFG